MFSIDKQKYLDFSIIIVIFTISRILFLFFTPYSFYNEEAKIGSIGHDIIFEKGLKLPFWGYLDSPHSGGSIFSGLIVVPFYIIFGDTYLALKITALILSLLTLILWYRLLLFAMEKRKDIFLFFLIFFTFATPHYVQKSVILAGNTVELMFFNILIISYFWQIRKRIVTVPRSYFFLGILCGFSFWIQFMSFYLFLTIISFSFITERFRIALIQSTRLLIGFLLGTLPLWIYNFIYQWATFTADRSLYVLFNLNKLKNFLFVDVPASFHFLDIGMIKSRYLSFIIFGLFILTVLIHLGKGLKDYIRTRNPGITRESIKDKLEIFLIFYICIFIIFTTFTTAPIKSVNAHGWNSMNIHAEYYIISLQLFMFALFILLNKYKNRFIFSINVIVSCIFILGYTSLFGAPYYNNRLVKPMHATEANAYECGLHFVRNPSLFFRFYKNIPITLQEAYMQGAKGLKEPKN